MNELLCLGVIAAGGQHSVTGQNPARISIRDEQELASDIQQNGIHGFQT